MRLDSFSALTFDCYGTLIDWEAGILAALRPWAAARRVTADDEELLAAFARAESRREVADPTAPYPRILAGVLEDLGERVRRRREPRGGGGVRRLGEGLGRRSPTAPEALAYLQRHYKLVIVSNVDRASFAHSNSQARGDLRRRRHRRRRRRLQAGAQPLPAGAGATVRDGSPQGPGAARRPEPLPRPCPGQAARPVDDLGQPPPAAAQTATRPAARWRRDPAQPRSRSPRTPRSPPWPRWSTCTATSRPADLVRLRRPTLPRERRCSPSAPRTLVFATYAGVVTLLPQCPPGRPDGDGPPSPSLQGGSGCEGSRSWWWPCSPPCWWRRRRWPSTRSTPSGCATP